jgi:hypothetical protein
LRRIQHEREADRAKDLPAGSFNLEEYLLYTAAAIKKAAELAKEAEEAHKVAADWYAADMARKKKQSKKICSDCTHCRWGADLPAGGFDLEEYFLYKAAANEKADELNNKYKAEALSEAAKAEALAEAANALAEAKKKRETERRLSLL